MLILLTNICPQASINGINYKMCTNRDRDLLLTDINIFFTERKQNRKITNYHLLNMQTLHKNIQTATCCLDCIL